MMFSVSDLAEDLNKIIIILKNVIFYGGFSCFKIKVWIKGEIIKSIHKKHLKNIFKHTLCTVELQKKNN